VRALHGHKTSTPEMIVSAHLRSRLAPPQPQRTSNPVTLLYHSPTTTPIPLAPLQIAAIDRARRIRLMMMHPSPPPTQKFFYKACCALNAPGLHPSPCRLVSHHLPYLTSLFTFSIVVCNPSPSTDPPPMPCLRIAAALSDARRRPSSGPRPSSSWSSSWS